MSIGKIGPFDIEKDSWDSYVDRLEQYFVANDVKAAVQVATLITAIGSDAYELMVNLCTPDKPSQKTYTELVEVMKSHLQPKPSLLAERFKFRQKTQKSDESIAKYVAELKKLTKNCKFTATSLTENLRDQFICGVVNEAIRQRLFTEDDISFERAFTIAVAMEAAENHAALVEDRGQRPGGAPASSVHQLTPNRRPAGGNAGRDVTRIPHSASTVGPRFISGAGGYNKTSQSASSTKEYSGIRCATCGEKHETGTCKFRNYVCRVCCREGHLKKMCPNLKKGTSFHNMLEEQVGYSHGDSSGSEEVHRRARRVPDARGRDARVREPVERALDQLVHDGVITPVNSSDWATPIVPVMKKDGSIRVCADFKLTLNKCLEVDRFPLPRVEDLLAKLHGGDKFTKLDLSQVYAQFELDESKKFTVINTHRGLFMYNRLVYGLASSPGIFQRKLEQLFGDLPKVGIFLDDLIITGVDDKSHLETLYEVFDRLKSNGLKIRKDKCTFLAESVTYLGHVINKKGVHTCPDKLKAIKNVPRPSNVSELRSFLGLVMYYAKFIRNISSLLSPLYNLLKKEVRFEWNQECDVAFERVKSLLMSSEILAHYSLELPLVLTADASGQGVGAVVSHLTPDGERPVAYASGTLNSAEKGYSQIEREALGIIFGIRKFHQYLYGRRFTLRTDHKPLVSIFGEKKGIPVMAASRLQRWAVILAGYDFDIEYVRSEKNSADALSRLPLPAEATGKTAKETTYLNFIQTFMPVDRKSVQSSTNRDEILRKVLLYLQSGWPGANKEEEIQPYYSRRHELYFDMGCIVWGYRLVIPSTLRDLMLKELHLGHMGIVKMKAMARSVMWWPGIDADIERACRDCRTCAEDAPAPPRASPQPWPYVSEPWSRLHVDFLGPFHGRTFLIIFDAGSKWLEVFQMNSTTAGAVIKVLRETFARFGLPKEVVSDNGPPFSSKEYNEFMARNGIKLSFAAPYHPSSNGAAEGAVKLCKRAVRKALRDGCDVDCALQAYLLNYRNVAHSTTGVSPATILQRRNLRCRLDLLKGDRQVEERVKETQEKQVKYAGGATRQFTEGDKVLFRNYSKGKKWLEGKVSQKTSSRNYVVVAENGAPVNRHVDQIKRSWADTFEWPSQPETPKTGLQSTTGDHAAAALDQAAGDTNPAETAPQVPQPHSSPASLLGPTLRPRDKLRPPRRFGFDFD